MKKIITILTLSLIIFAAACSKKAAPSKTAEAPKVKATTYTVDVLPLIQMKCTPCHLASKGGKKGDFETYASAKTYAADMLVRVQLNPADRGFMPFKHPKLTDDEIAIFKKWVEGGIQEK